MLTEPTADKLRSLRLAAMADTWLEQRAATDMDELTFDERFGMLVDAEYLARRNRKLANLLRIAQLRWSNACIEDIDADKTRGLDRATVRTLANCEWLAQSHNLIITGATGVGKTWVACAFAQQACRRGYSTLYRRVPRLFDEITLARASGTWPRLLKKWAKTDLLVLDDWALVTLNAQRRSDLLEILEDRENTRSTIIASQIPHTEWHAHIGDATLADAILDRVLHNAHKIALTGPSRRKEKATTNT